MGDGVAAIALPLYAASITGNARLVTGIYAAELAPWLFLGRWLGARADRDRTPGATMVRADLARAVALVAVAVTVATGHGIIAVLCATAIVIGTGHVAHSAATSRLLADLARGPDLARSNGRLAAVESAAVALVGPAVGGFLFAAGRSVPFTVDAVSFALSAGLIVRCWRHQSPSTHPATAPDRAGDGIDGGPSRRQQRRQGSIVRHVTGGPVLGPLYVMAIAMGLGQAIVLSSLVLYARQVLGLTAREYGIFMAITATGNIAAALLTPRWWTPVRTGPLLAFGYGIVAASYLVLAHTHDPIVGCVALVGEAVGIATVATISPTLRIDYARGRTGAVVTFFRQGIYTAHAVGAIAAGSLIIAIGYRHAYQLAAVAEVAALVALPTLTRQLRQAIATPLAFADLSSTSDGATTEPDRWGTPELAERPGW